MNRVRLISFIFIIISSTFFGCSKSGDEPKGKEDTKKIKAVVEEKEFKQVPLPPDKILNPMDSIKELDKKIDAYKTGSNLTSEEIDANKRLKREIIRGTFDLKELCKLALARHWNDITNEDQKYFSKLMTNLLEKKAIFSKEQVKGEGRPYRINYQKNKFLDPEKKKSLVTTKIIIPSKKIDLNLNYKLKITPYGWKIFDVIVDDASLVENYKFQFDAIIKKHGYPDLVRRMENKLKEME